MTNNQTRVDRIIAAAKNHWLLSWGIVIALVVITGAELISAVGVWRSAGPREASLSIEQVLIGTGASARQYRITIGNSGTRAGLITHVRVLHRSLDNALVHPSGDDSHTVCANGPVFFLADEVALSRNALGARVVGRIEELGRQTADFPVPAYGWMYEACGGADRQFVLDFDAAIDVPAGDNTAFFVRVPNRLHVRPDSFETRFDRSRQRHGQLLTSGDYFADLTPTAFAFPAAWLEHAPVIVDSLLYPRERNRVLPRFHTVSIALLTSREQYLTRLDTIP